MSRGVAALACVFVLSTGCGASSAQREETVEEKARHLVEALVRNEFVEATKDFGDVMKKGLPPAMLEETWKSLLVRTGPFQSIRYAAERPADGNLRVLILRCEFKNQDIDTLVTFDEKAQVVGLYFRPPAS